MKDLQDERPFVALSKENSIALEGDIPEIISIRSDSILEDSKS
jgi:hypothetical protein